MYNPKEDPMFARPYIDIEEQRVRSNIPFTYVHGSFEGTDVKFSFCFPEKNRYEGRFYHFLSPSPAPNEEIASLSEKRKGMEDHIVFALTHGAYFVESNMGASSANISNPDPTLLYRSSAAVAEYSREAAKRIYGCSRPYGYVYGGSGGGYKTCACIENTSAFDSAVPYVTAAPVALPNILTVGAHALRVLRNKLDWIADAVEPGSSHDIYSGLNDEERAAFDEAAKMGIPLESWRETTPGINVLELFAPQIRAVDPAYFIDFWTKPGYLGTEPGSSAIRDRVQCKAVIKRMYIPELRREENSEIDDRNRAGDAWEKLIDSRFSTDPVIELENLPEIAYPVGVKISFLTGNAQGHTLSIKSIEGNLVIPAAFFGWGSAEETLRKAVPGDTVLLDNSDAIAVQTYHRHQVPDPEFTVWNQFRNIDGTPKYPQREKQLYHDFAYHGAGSIQNGNIQGKVIMVNCIADGGATTWMADWYRSKVESVYGPDADNRFRLWCMEHCGHMDKDSTLQDLHTPSYLGALYRALIEVAGWVEKGIEPSATSGYRITDGQPSVPLSAKERRGVQPVVSLTTVGGKRAEIFAGEAVELKVEVDLPHKDDRVTSVEWSFEGEPFVSGQAHAKHVYCTAGTFFVSVRVTTNRSDDIYTQIQNIDRVRVVVL